MKLIANIKNNDSVVEYFLNNINEANQFKLNYANKYSLDNIKLMDTKDFIQTHFKLSSFFLFQGFIQIDPSLVTDIQTVIYMDKTPYASISVYFDDETNLSLSSIQISQYQRHFVNVADAFHYIFSMDSVLTSLDEFTALNDVKGLHKEIELLETNDDFFGNIVQDGIEYCQMIIRQLPSNLDFWSIRISGNDDYSISKDFLSEKEALAERDLLKHLEKVHQSKLTNYYFSN